MCQKRSLHLAGELDVRTDESMYNHAVVSDYALTRLMLESLTLYLDVVAACYTDIVTKVVRINCYTTGKFSTI